MLKLNVNVIEGGIRADPRTILCEIKCEDGKIYKIRSFLENAQVYELNTRIALDPELLITKVILINYNKVIL